jgi:hypothetical protein
VSFEKYQAKKDGSCIGYLNDGIQSFFDLARQRIQQFVLLLLRKRAKDVIEQGRGGADELAGVLFHGWVKRICHRVWGIENGELNRGKVLNDFLGGTSYVQASLQPMKSLPTKGIWGVLGIL